MLNLFYVGVQGKRTLYVFVDAFGHLDAPRLQARVIVDDGDGPAHPFERVAATIVYQPINLAAEAGWKAVDVTPLSPKHQVAVRGLLEMAAGRMGTSWAAWALPERQEQPI